MDSARVVPVIRYLNGQRRVGSGYRVTQRFVLTAAHCVTGGNHQVWLADGHRRARVVANAGGAPDLALLQIVPDAAAGEAEVADVAPTPCARVDQTIPGKLGDCIAVGYPDFARTDTAPFTTGQLDGWIPTAAGMISTARGQQPGHLVLKAEGTPPRELPAAATELGQTPWAGMSGAAVFALGRLVGVVAEHHLPHGDGSLSVVPVEWAGHVKDPGQRDLLLAALGVSSASDLEVLGAGSGTRRRWTGLVPRAPQVVVDRPAEQRLLHRAVLGDADATVVVAGMGGAGKSVLVAAAARAALGRADPELAARYPDGAVWIAVGRDRLAVDAQVELARALGEERPDLGTDWRTNLVRLQQLTAGRRGLIVLDDVWTAEALKPFRLEGPGLRTVITTRNAKLAADIGGLLVPVGELEPGQSRDLLARAAGTEPRSLPAEADALLRELGHLALGIAMAGAMAAGHGPGAWRALLNRLRSAQLEKVAHPFADNYQYATLLRAVEVAADDLDPRDQELWAQLAVFAGRGPVPRSAIAALWASADEDFLDTDNRIERLTRRWLIQRTADERYVLHDLQYDVAAGRLGSDLPRAHRCLLDGYRLQVAAALGLAESADWGVLTERIAGLPDTHPAWSQVDDGYLLDHLVAHLRAAEADQSAWDLLGSYQWIRLGSTRRVFGRVLADYERLPAGNPLRLVRDALGRSARTLAADPSSLPDQLLGRLATAADPALAPLLARLRTEQARRPLRIVRSGLQHASGPLIHVLSGHRGGVSAVAVTGDGTRAVTGGHDNTAIVWDLATGTAQHILRGHRDSVVALAVTTDGSRAVTAGRDRTAIIWDLDTGRAVHTLSGHSKGLSAVAITPDGTQAVTASDDATAIVWDLRTGAYRCTLSGHSKGINAVAITPDGTRAVTASDDHTSMVWNLTTGRVMHTFPGEPDRFFHIDVGQDGELLVFHGDGSVDHWNPSAGMPPPAITGHSREVVDVAVTRDQTHAVTVSYDRAALVWDLVSGAMTHALIGEVDAAYRVAVTADGTRAVTGSDDRTPAVWDLLTGRQVHALAGHQSSVFSVAVTADGARAITGARDGTVVVSDLATGGTLLTLAGHRTQVRAIAVSHDGSRAVTASTDNTAIVWDLSTDRTSHQPPGHREWVRALAVTRDGARAVTGSSDQTAIVWDLTTGSVVHILAGHRAEVLAVAAAADGTQAVTAGDDGRVISWDLNTGAVQRILTEYGSQIYASAAVTGDGTRAIATTDHHTATVWDLTTGKALHVLRGHRDYILALAVTGDGTRAITTSSDETAIVWDLTTGEALHVLTGHRDRVQSVAVTADGTRAITTSDDKTAIVWDLSDGEALQILSGHQGGTFGVAITADDSRAVTTSSDHTAIVWDLTTGQALHILAGHDAPIQVVSISSDDSWILTGSDDSTVAVWNLATGERAATFRGDDPMLHGAWAGDTLTIAIADYRGGVFALRFQPPERGR